MSRFIHDCGCIEHDGSVAPCEMHQGAFDDRAELDRLKAELAAAREKIAFYEKPCPEAERWPGPCIVPDYMRLYQVERWRNKELNAELAKLRALCAALPEGVMVCSASRGKAAIANKWIDDVRAAGRGEGAK